MFPPVLISFGDQTTYLIVTVHDLLLHVRISSAKSASAPLPRARIPRRRRSDLGRTRSIPVLHLPWFPPRQLPFTCTTHRTQWDSCPTNVANTPQRCRPSPYWPELRKGAVLQYPGVQRAFKGLGVAKRYCRRDLIGDTFVQCYLGARSNSADRARHFLRLHGVVLLFAPGKTRTPPPSTALVC